MDDRKAYLRHCEDDLYVSGIGVVVMGVWSVMKVLMTFMVNYKEFFDPEAEDQKFEIIAVAVIYALVAVLLILILKVHLYIGLNAIKAAKGGKYKKGYLPWTVILLVFTIASLATYYDSFQDLNNIDTTIASFLVDLTTIYIFTIVITSTLKIKKFKQTQVMEAT